MKKNKKIFLSFVVVLVLILLASHVDGALAQTASPNLSPTPTPTATATATASATPTTLPDAGVSLPTLFGLLLGALLVIGSFLLAF